MLIKCGMAVNNMFIFEKKKFPLSRAELQKLIAEKGTPSNKVDYIV